MNDNPKNTEVPCLGFYGSVLNNVSIFQRVAVRTVPAVSTDCTIALPYGIRLDWIVSSDAQSLALLGGIVDQLNSK